MEECKTFLGISQSIGFASALTSTTVATCPLLTGSSASSETSATVGSGTEVVLDLRWRIVGRVGTGWACAGVAKDILGEGDRVREREDERDERRTGASWFIAEKASGTGAVIAGR